MRRLAVALGLCLLAPGAAFADPALPAADFSGSGVLVVASSGAARAREAAQISFVPSGRYDPFLQTSEVALTLRGATGTVSLRCIQGPDARGRAQYTLAPDSLHEELAAAFLAWCGREEPPEACGAALAVLEARAPRSQLRVRASRPDAYTLLVRLRGRADLALVDPATGEEVFRHRLAFQSRSLRGWVPTVGSGFSGSYVGFTSLTAPLGGDPAP
jgi:hypothetical protein